MTKTVRMCGFWCALIVLALPWQLHAQTGDDGAVRAVVEAIATAVEAKDMAALDTLFALDPWVRVIEGAGVNRGWYDYRDNHLKPELEEFENLTYRFLDLEPQVRGDVAWAAFRYDFMVDTERGHVEVEGRGTAILERRDERWLIVHLHTSGRRKRAQP